MSIKNRTRGRSQKGGSAYFKCKAETEEGKRRWLQSATGSADNMSRGKVSLIALAIMSLAFAAIAAAANGGVTFN
jgi:hypothetical protein